MSHDVSNAAATHRADPTAHGCSCGHAEGIPELDARVLPPAIRHAAILGAFDSIPTGGSLILIAPHDPIPLLEQLSARVGGALEIRYLERGPEAWRLQLTRG